ncbi:NAD(P)/FAD-dependent oxidoreductase [Halocola ammonii]
MESSDQKHVVIIGNGIAGITAARHIRKKSDHKITVISAESKHFFSRTALMYIYMGHMKYEHTKPYEDWFWEKNDINLVYDFVSEVNTNSKLLQLKSGKQIKYDDLILATGSKYNMFGWKGQGLKGVQGLYSVQDLEKLEENTHPPFPKPQEKKVHRAVIVGGGLIGVELSEMLMTREVEVTFLVRESRYWGNVMPEEEGALIDRHMKEHHVDVRYNEELEEIIGDESGRVKAVRTVSGEVIPCQFVGITAGVHPNIEVVKHSRVETDKGVLINEFLETNIPNVYAIGDCAQMREPIGERKPIEQVWYTGRIMGETVAFTICGERTKYQPGVWFNSAKFFDIEYQTYGWVMSELQEGEEKFVWTDDSGKKLLKLVYDKSSRKLKGINTFGIRLRHNICADWIEKEVSVEYALEKFRTANFDPEFFKRHEKEIINQFNSENGTSLKPAGKSWKRILEFYK